MKNKTNQTLQIPTREEFHKSYGGKIYPSDFQTSYHEKNNNSGSPIASRIETDLIREKNLISMKGGF